MPEKSLIALPWPEPVQRQSDRDFYSGSMLTKNMPNGFTCPKNWQFFWWDF